MGIKKAIVFLLLLGFSFFVFSSEARDFKLDWQLKNSSGYADWAGNSRFNVNDNIIFVYKKSEDSVMLVDKTSYDSCNVSKPIVTKTDGNSTFNLDKPDYFYFISGNVTNCNAGQKIVIKVIHVTAPPSPPTPSVPPPSDIPAPPSTSPVAAPPPVSSSPGRACSLTKVLGLVGLSLTTVLVGLIG